MVHRSGLRPANILRGIIIGTILLHKPIALGTMYLVDLIGNMTGANVSHIIDILNNLYYL